MRIVVDFPEPFGPRKPYIWPRGTLRSSALTARRSPKCLLQTARFDGAAPGTSLCLADQELYFDRNAIGQSLALRP